MCVVVQFFERESGLTRSHVTHPEADGSGPPVEVRIRLSAERFAIKHTLLEPFAGAMQTGKDFQELTGEIVAELDGDLPVPGVYDLVSGASDYGPASPDARRSARR